VVDNIGQSITELTESLNRLSGPIDDSKRELAASISGRITELSETLNRVVTESQRGRVARD
jgi:hypothetical protein